MRTTGNSVKPFKDNVELLGTVVNYRNGVNYRITEIARTLKKHC